MNTKHNLIYILLVSANFAFGETRTFTDIQGRTTVAELLNYENDLVTIKRKDGTVFSIPIKNFSLADRNYIASMAGVKITENAESNTTLKESGSNTGSNLDQIFILRNFKTPKTSEGADIVKSVIKYHNIAINPEMDKSLFIKGELKGSIIESLEAVGIENISIRIKEDINQTNEFIVENLKKGPIWINFKKTEKLSGGFLLGYNNQTKHYTVWMARDQETLKINYDDFQSKANSLNTWQKK